MTSAIEKLKRYAELEDDANPLALGQIAITACEYLASLPLSEEEDGRLYWMDLMQQFHGFLATLRSPGKPRSLMIFSVYLLLSTGRSWTRNLDLEVLLSIEFVKEYFPPGAIHVLFNGNLNQFLFESRDQDCLPWLLPSDVAEQKSYLRLARHFSEIRERNWFQEYSLSCGKHGLETLLVNFVEYEAFLYKRSRNSSTYFQLLGLYHWSKLRIQTALSTSPLCEDRHMDELVVLTVSSKFLSAFRKWLSSYLSCSRITEGTALVVGCLDIDCFKALSSSAMLQESRILLVSLHTFDFTDRTYRYHGGHGDDSLFLWSAKTAFIYGLSSTLNLPIIYTDVDAFWARDFLALSNELKETCDFAVQAGCGMPKPFNVYRDKHGPMVACMGFYFINNTHSALQFLKAIYFLGNDLGNDQWAANFMLMRHRVAGGKSSSLGLAIDLDMHDGNIARCLYLSQDIASRGTLPLEGKDRSKYIYHNPKNLGEN